MKLDLVKRVGLILLGVTLVTACQKNGLKPLSETDLKEGPTEAPIKNFWANRAFRGVTGQEISSEQWGQLVSGENLGTVQRLYRTDHYVNDIMMVSSGGDVLLRHGDVAESHVAYYYGGALSSEATSYLQSLVGALTAQVSSGSSQAQEIPCPGISSGFSRYSKTWMLPGLSTKLAFVDGGMESGYAAGTCQLASFPLTVGLQTYLSWMNYIFSYVTR